MLSRVSNPKAAMRVKLPGRSVKAGPTGGRIHRVEVTCRVRHDCGNESDLAEFQRHFARMKATAKAGEAIYVTAGAEEFVFQAVKPKAWQGALKGKAKIAGDLFSTGLEWEASR